MSDTTELNDLQSLVECPGWPRLKQRLMTEWGPAGNRYVQALERVANDPDPGQAAQNMRMVIWVRKEIEGFFMGIEGRLSTLKAKDKPVEPSMSRRGSL